MTKKRSIHLLRRIAAVQDIVLYHQRRGATQTWIYNNIIATNPQITISKSTFDRYMSINAKRELKEIENQ